MAAKQNLSGWGLFPRADCLVHRPEKQAGLAAVGQATIGRGCGRSYGDASLNTDRNVVLTERVNRFLDFDAGTGLLRAEAGVTLEEIFELFVPRGWFPPVTPGTSYVTLGGCVAADVHGKNHHRDGSFGDHVEEIGLALADGTRVRCSAAERPELFWATVGGMGLTGFITDVALRMIPIETAYMRVRHHEARNLDAMLQLCEDETRDDHYTVAWIDCLKGGKRFGRGVFMAGHHAGKDEVSAADPLQPKRRRRKTYPSFLPGWLLNRCSVKAFNAVYNRRAVSRREPFLAPFGSFFHPLDAVLQWNRMYGKRGFIQYQCVLPSAQAPDGLRLLLERLVASGRGSFLAVLKRFGEQGRGLLSFPMAGYTLSLDIRAAGERTFELIRSLDEVVLERGGRVYLAKDALLTPSSLRAMYPRLDEWLAIKRQIDPEGRFSSDLSRRLEIG